MNYKMVSFDLDGTLLNRKHEVTKTTLDLIKLLKKMGVIIIINTGRSFNASIYYSKLIEADYMIGCNGAFIYDCKNKSIHNPHPIDTGVAYEIIEMLYDHKDKIKIQWDSMEMYYSNNITPFENYYIQNYRRDFPEDIFNYKIINEKEDIQLIKHEEIYQVFFHPMDNDNRIYHSILKQLKDMGELSIVDFTKEYTDINHIEANKGRALSDLAHKLHLSSEDVLVFGDGDNDITMFQYAGHAVAMENACIQLKEIAHRITLNHDENGVAHALDNIFKLQRSSEINI